jgi:hypothetical protein
MNSFSKSTHAYRLLELSDDTALAGHAEMNQCSDARGGATEWDRRGRDTDNSRTGEINTNVANKIETQINKRICE